MSRALVLVTLIYYGAYAESISGTDDFELLNGEDFLLLDDSNFLLLGI